MADSTGEPSFDPKETANLRAEKESLDFECRALRSMNRALEAKLALATAERDRLRESVAAVEGSRPWRIIQAVRGMFGRRW